MEKEDTNDQLEYEFIDYDDFANNPKYKKIIQDNDKYLEEFENYLIKKGLKRKTINNHIGNMDFFLNSYMLLDEMEGMKEGIKYISDYLGNWFIRKAMWSDERSIKSNITSFKKFYKCMLENGNITKKDYDDLIETIKEEKSIWIEKVNEYNSGNFIDFFDWLF